MIFSINIRGNVLYPITKESFNLTDQDVYEMIRCEHNKTIDRLKMKGVDYAELKRALIPNQEKKRHELCLVIDTYLIDDCFYGKFVFDKILPVLDKNSTYSICIGDYIDVLSNLSNSQMLLDTALHEVLIKENESNYIHSNQYFLVYFNSVTEKQGQNIIGALKKYKWFYGYAYVDNDSVFKTYISMILNSLCIKCKNVIVASHPADYSDQENINISFFSYESVGFRFVSVNEESYSIFLSYKIESVVQNEEDEGFSFNALFPKFNSLKMLNLEIKDGKYEYLCSDATGKSGILKSLGYTFEDKMTFKEDIYYRICNKHIFNLELNDYGIYKFNVCIDMPTCNGDLRKTTIVLKYDCELGGIELITMT